MSELGGMGGMGGMGAGGGAGAAGGAGGYGGVNGTGGSFLGTLADAYANPVMVEALILGREATTVPDVDCYEPVMPEIDDPKQMERWEVWVRACVAIGEMLPGLTFQPTTNGFQVLSSLSSSPSLSSIAEVRRPQSTTFEKQIPMVLSWAELRDDRATEVLAQVDPQYAFWASIVYLHPERTRRTLELINMVLQFCVYVEVRFKQALGCYRPVEYNAEVQPMITTPGHGTFPMGHAAQAYAVVQVLKTLLQLDPKNSGHKMVIDQLRRQAARIATNRVVAGMHFPVDAMAGHMLGVALGEYFCGRCTGSQTYMSRTFIAAGIDADPTTDFNPFNSDQYVDNPNSPFYSQAAGLNVTQSLIMWEVWQMASAEWKGRFGVPIT